MSNKHVFDDNREIAHLWFHQGQGDARNRQNNFYFSGETIYSYGSHFPIARIVTPDKGTGKGVKTVLLTTRTYSNTTSQHIHAVRASIPAGVKVFHVTSVDREGARMLADWDKRIESARGEVTIKDRIQGKTRAKRFGVLCDLVADANEYCSWFGEKRRYAVPSDVETLRGQMEVEQRKADAKARRDNARKEREHQAEYDFIRTMVLPEWIHGGLSRWIDDKGVGHSIQTLPESYLRIPRKDYNESALNDEVETSHGARVPVEHVRRILPVIKRLIETGTEYKRNGHTIHLGHYPLDKIDAEGNLTVGCHYFKRDEVLRFMKVVEGLAPITPIPASTTSADVQTDGEVSS